MSGSHKVRFSPTLCVTHACNLDCTYCYQNHDLQSRMTFDTARKCIDWIFNNVPEGMDGIEIGFIGGEPLLEFELIKQIFEYTNKQKYEIPYVFYATTNGTVLTDDMKEWFAANRTNFVLGLSLDGLPDTQNHNRCNSYNNIDFDFFAKTWPKQGVKMTLSEYSLYSLADNIKHIHSLGFHNIGGVNLFEGQFDWSDDKYIQILVPQLSELVEFYVRNDDLPLDQMMNKRLDMCEVKQPILKKWCGIGTGALFFDVDGTKRPCPFVTPMTFDSAQLERICKCDFANDAEFVDEECFRDCYIYPICPHCSGADYLTQGTFKKRDKSKCKIQKLIALFSADLQAKRIIKNPSNYDDAAKYHTINAIKRIRQLYLEDFIQYLN